MTDRRSGTDAQLPTTHFFITVARGSSIRTVTVRTGLLRAGMGAAALLGCWLACSSLYLAFHDDLVATLMARQASMQYAYEDRIAALRKQVEHQASVELVSQNTLDGKMSELGRRAAALEMRASLVAQLADRSGLGRPADRAPVRSALRVPTQGTEAGPESIDNPWSGEATHPIDGKATDNGAMLPLSQDKPRPEAAASFEQTRPDGATSLHVRLSGLEEALERVDGTQYREIATIGAAARRKADGLRAVLLEAGLSPERLGPATPSGSVGGPFVPLDEAFTTSPFGRAVLALQGDVAATEHLRRVIPQVPLASPLVGPQEVTSPFGARVDPFFGRLAMHTGVDLRDETGTEVRATAAGRVVSAGPAGGYGTMIELDHGHGLATRYAHLSAVLVDDGQHVEKGDVIGRVGSTGRATGPHLHYETRIDGNPVDPMRFLLAGQRLAAIDPAL